MARDGSGTMSNALPDVIAGDVIEATWANTTLNDVKAEITDSLSRSGKGNMSAAMKVIAGSVSAPGLSFTSEANSGLYRAGAADIRMALNSAEAWRVTSAGFRTPGALTVADSNLTLTTGNLIPATAGKGIDFAAQTPTAATGAATTAEILGHYEEGTWTPNLWDNSLSSAEGQTYFIQYGFFTRIGRVVFLEGYLGVTSIGTLTTAQVCNIGPLPYTSSSATGYSGSASFVDTSGLAMTATGCSMAGRIPGGVNYLTISEWDVITGTSGFLVSQISEPASFFFSGTYFI